MATKPQRDTPTGGWAEQLVEVGIIAIKGFIIMLWLQTLTSPTQFFVGGLMVLLLAHFLSKHMPQPQQSETATRVAPAKGSQSTIDGGIIGPRVNVTVSSLPPREGPM